MILGRAFTGEPLDLARLAKPPTDSLVYPPDQILGQRPLRFRFEALAELSPVLHSKDNRGDTVHGEGVSVGQGGG